MPKVSIPVSKARQSIEVNVDNLTSVALESVIFEGLKTLINRKMLKFCVVDLEGDYLKRVQKLAMKQAEANLKTLLK